MCTYFKAIDFAYVVYHLAISFSNCSYSGVYNRYMVLNATFNNISVISLRSVLLVEENGVHKKKKKKNPPASTTSH